MIAPLRKAHRASFRALALLLPALFVASLVARHPPATMASLPGELADWSVPSAVSAELELRLVEGDPAAIEVLHPAAWDAADALLYWSPSATGDGTGVPDDAILLGSLRPGGPRRFELETPSGATGLALVYDLAKGERIASARLAPGAGAAR